jgi:SAM-dependent methyltransferase
MLNDPTYRDYVQETGFHKNYIAYQGRYKVNMRESDRFLLGHIARTMPETPERRRGLRVLDIGCSTGNFLMHLRNAFPELSLTGADFAPQQVEACQADPELTGIQFSVKDMLELGEERSFDRIIANAVAVYFPPPEYEQAMRSVACAIKPGGYYFAFEWLHPFRQELQIIEWGRSHPDGLKIHFRSYAFVRAALEAAGFTDVQFHPFQIPIDLPDGPTPAKLDEGFEDLNTYTVRTETGERIMFRGALAQPWCHLVARRKPS